MPKLSMLAKEWLRENDPERQFKPKRYIAKKVPARRHMVAQDEADQPSMQRKAQAEQPRRSASGKNMEPPPMGARFIKMNLRFRGSGCLYLPFAAGHGPAAVTYHGKRWQASRLMCTLAHGRPPTENHVACHLCGNGGRSCVNPNHLVWGTFADNVRDDLTHRAMEGSTAEERVAAALAWRAAVYGG